MVLTVGRWRSLDDQGCAAERGRSSQSRQNRVVNLESFTLAQCEEYMRGRGSTMSRRELAEGYMVFGGSPNYWNLLDTSLSLSQNIDRPCFTAAGELAGEFKRLYASVFRSSEKHLKVVLALYDSREGLTREEISWKPTFPRQGSLPGCLRIWRKADSFANMRLWGRRKEALCISLWTTSRSSTFSS